MARFIIGLLVGLLIGGLLTFFIFVGTPGAVKVPGAPIKPPDPGGPAPGTAQIVLRQEFFNEVLGTIFGQLSPPSFQLGSRSAECAGQITIIQEGSGVRTGVAFQNGKLGAPLAFTGSYNSPFGCLQFTGWAQSNMELRFDHASQSVFGQLNIETVNLDGVNPIWSALITPIVQSTLNERVNPIRIIDGSQLVVNLPIAAAKGNLQASAQDVRAEVRDNALNLFVIYGFSGTAAQPVTP